MYIETTNSFEAEQVLHGENLWNEPADDFRVEVFTSDYNTALDILADHFLLKSLVDFAEKL